MERKVGWIERANTMDDLHNKLKTIRERLTFLESMAIGGIVTSKSRHLHQGMAHLLPKAFLLDGGEPIGKHHPRDLASVRLSASDACEDGGTYIQQKVNLGGRQPRAEPSESLDCSVFRAVYGLKPEQLM